MLRFVVKKLKNLMMKGEKKMADNTVKNGSNSGYFLIKSKLNGLVLDVAGNNAEAKTHLVVYPVKGTNGEPNQQWKITEDGFIESRLNGFVVDIPESRTEPFTPVITYPVNGSNGTPNQQWTITEDGLIKSKLNGLVLDVLGSSTEPLTPVVTYPVNGDNGTANQQWELVAVPEESSPASASFLTLGPRGSFINAEEFAIQPKTPQSRIKAVRIKSGWAIDNIQVQYEDIANNPPETYESIAAGASGGQADEFSIEAGDYITGIVLTWGKEGPDYPEQDIISLQFQTYKGVKSQVFGGSSSQKETATFSLEAFPNHEIIGFFGAHTLNPVSNTDVLVRLGAYIRPVAS